MLNNLDNKIKSYNKIIKKLNKIEKHFNESGINYRKYCMLPILETLFDGEIKKNLFL